MINDVAKIFRIVLLVALLPGLLMSCGGGGGGGAETPSIPLKTSDIRIERPGDTWSYSVAGTYVYNGVTYNLSGNEDEIITATTKTSPINGIACSLDYTSFKYTLSLNNNFANYTDNSYTYYTQDSSGSYFLHGEGDESGDYWITSPTVGYIKLIGSPLTIGDSYSTTVNYDSGNTETYSYTVMGKEYVGTAVANYESYKVSFTSTTNYVSGSYTKIESVSTSWIVPGMGVAKIVESQKGYIGTILIANMNLTYSLKSTNVAY